MSKKSLRSPLKVLAATSVAIFSLLTVFTSTAAWFDSRRSFDNAGNNFEVTTTHNLKEIRIYSAISADISTGYSFSTTPTQTITVDSATPTKDDWKYQEGVSSAVPYSSASPVNMNPQVSGPNSTMIDDPFSPLSPYHPLLIVVEYAKTVTPTQDSPLQVKMHTDSRFLTPSRSSPSKSSNDYPAQIASITNDAPFPMSSLIHTYSAGYEDSSDIPFTYALTSNQVAAGKPLVSGPDLEHGAFASLVTTTDNETAVLFDQNPTVCTFDGSSVEEVNCVAIILEYYVEVIEYIYSYYVGLEALEFNHHVYCDWSLMV